MLCGDETAAEEICVRLMREISMGCYIRSIGIYRLVFECECSNAPAWRHRPGREPKGSSFAPQRMDAGG